MQMLVQSYMNLFNLKVYLQFFVSTKLLFFTCLIKLSYTTPLLTTSYSVSNSVDKLFRFCGQVKALFLIY